MKSLFFTIDAPGGSVNNLGVIWLTGYSLRQRRNWFKQEARNPGKSVRVGMPGCRRIGDWFLASWLPASLVFLSDLSDAVTARTAHLRTRARRHRGRARH